MTRSVTLAPRDASTSRSREQAADDDQAPGHTQMLMAAGGNQAMVQRSRDGGDDGDASGEGGGDDIDMAGIIDIVGTHYPLGTAVRGGPHGVTVLMELTELSAPFPIDGITGLWPIKSGEDIGNLASCALAVVEGAVPGGRATWRELLRLAVTRGVQSGDDSGFAAVGLALDFGELDSLVTGYEGLLGAHDSPEAVAETLAHGCQRVDNAIFSLVAGAVNVTGALEGLYELTLPGAPPYLVRDGEEDAILTRKTDQLRDKLDTVRSVYDESVRAYEGQAKVNDDHEIVAFIAGAMGDGVKAPGDMTWRYVQECIGAADRALAGAVAETTVEGRVSGYRRTLPLVERAARATQELLEAVVAWKDDLIAGAQGSIGVLKGIIKFCALVIATAVGGSVGRSVVSKFGLAAGAEGVIGGAASSSATSIVNQLLDTGQVDVIKFGSDVAAGAIAAKVAPKLVGKTGELCQRFGFNKVAVDLATKHVGQGTGKMLKGAIQDTVLELRGQEVTREEFLRHAITNFAQGYAAKGLAAGATP